MAASDDDPVSSTAPVQEQAEQQREGALIPSDGRQAHVDHLAEERLAAQTHNEHQQGPAQAQNPGVASPRRSARVRGIRRRAVGRAFHDRLLQRLHEGMDRFESLDVVLLTGLSRTYEEFCANFGVDVRAVFLEVAEEFDIENLDDLFDI